MKMDMCSAMVALHGDKRTIVARGKNNPLSYPEIELIITAHGDRSVTDVKVIQTVDADHDAEIQRLKYKYKNQAFQNCYPGARPRLPMTAPDDIPRAYEVPEKKPAKADSETA